MLFYFSSSFFFFFHFSLSCFFRSFRSFHSPICSLRWYTTHTIFFYIHFCCFFFSSFFFIFVALDSARLQRCCFAFRFACLFRIKYKNSMYKKNLNSLSFFCSFAIVDVDLCVTTATMWTYNVYVLLNRILCELWVRPFRSLCFFDIVFSHFFFSSSSFSFLFVRISCFFLYFISVNFRCFFFISAFLLLPLTFIRTFFFVRSNCLLLFFILYFVAVVVRRRCCLSVSFFRSFHSNFICFMFFSCFFSCLAFFFIFALVLCVHEKIKIANVHRVKRRKKTMKTKTTMIMLNAS